MRRASMVLVLAGACLAVPGMAQAAAGHGGHTVRFATFNASLNRPTQGELAADLATPDDAQANNVAEIIQRARPDVLLVNEFDYDAAGSSVREFRRNYLERPHNGAKAIRYPYAYTAPSNTGIASGHDLNNDGSVVNTPGSDAYGQDALGYGFFPGQYGMVVYSKYPLDTRHVRTFQKFLWKDMPGADLPADPKTGGAWYDDAELKILRLSSKSHWDVPVRVGRRTVHFLVSHPTPPSFDGAEDRNGRRNHDEIRFWSDYVRPDHSAYAHPSPGHHPNRAASRHSYIYDDRGRRGGLAPGASFVIAADMNADPNDGDSYDHAADQLLDNPRIDTGHAPTSAGGPDAARIQGAANADHTGDPRYDTADFADALPAGPGNLRVDYVLPSRDLHPQGGGIFWPTSTSPLARLTWGDPLPSSDHHLTWQDLRP